MNTVTQKMMFHQSLIKYSMKYGVTKAAIKYAVTRQYIYFRMLRKLGEPRQTPPNPKYIPKPYEKMLYPGQRFQIDVKVVPTACIVGDAKGEKFYQYTAIDEYSRI